MPTHSDLIALCVHSVFRTGCIPQDRHCGPTRECVATLNQTDGVKIRYVLISKMLLSCHATQGSQPHCTKRLPHASDTTRVAEAESITITVNV